VGSGTNAEDRLMFIVQELKAARGWLGAEGGAGRLRVMERELDVARGERDQAVKREQAAVRQAARLEARLRRYEKGESVAKTNALVVLPATIRADAARLMDEGQYDKAIGLLREGYEVLPDRQDFEILAAVAACRAGRFQQATAMLKPYDVKHPVNADALLTLGMAWMGQGKIGEARVATEKALLINPKSAEAHYNMAQIFLTLTPADPVSAEKHYRRALELGMEADREFENSLRMALIVSRLRTRAAK
jgi:tetratricopeptide (TPR) repeat protein